MKLKKWQIFICIILVGGGTYWACDFIKNSRAYEVKTKVFEEIDANIRAEKTAALANIGGIQWDYVCLASYEARGIDVADALYVANHNLGNTKVDFSDFSVANEYYNEFKDSTYGLVFINTSQKLFVAISFNDVVHVNTSGNVCSKAENASLLKAENEATGRYGAGRQLTFAGKM